MKLRHRIKYVDVSYFDLVDLGFYGKQSRLYEFKIVELLNLIDALEALHLSGGNRPEIVAYTPKVNPHSGVIMDSKAHKDGFNLPISERDKMVRYINEYNRKDPKLNDNRWWENFQAPDYPKNPIRYSFVSGNFVGRYLDQIKYILTQTGINGSAISSEKLIEKVDSILDLITHIT